MTDAARERFGNVGWPILAGLLTVVAVVCFALWADRSSPSSLDAQGSGPTTAIDSPSPPAPGTAAVQEPARPISLSIPSIEVTTRVTRLGLQTDGSVEVPSKPALAGWFRLGPPPGAVGSSVILGHVDSAKGPAVFARLNELQPGDQVMVHLDDGSTAQFGVLSVRTYANPDFPARRVYGNHGQRSELNLVTCGGAYDASRGGYQANVVVNAELV